MGDDLKTTLGKVASSAGRKTYAFAYLAGKRKDKKGEGSLDVVPGRKTFKKDDLADELDTQGELFQGSCWGDSTGKVIFFSGKTLKDSIVAKMKTMVTKSTGKTFDFQLSDEDEEKRHAILESVEQAAERNRKSGGAPGTSTSSQTSSTSTTKDSPVPPAPPPKAPTPPTAQPKTAKPAADPAARSYEALLASMQAPLEQLQGTKPTEAGKIKQIVDAAGKYAKPGEYPKAVSFLKEAAKALAAAAPAESAVRAKKVAEAWSGDGESAADSGPKLARARLFWNASRTKIESDLRNLEESIVQACEANNKDPEAEYVVDLDEVKSKAKELHKIALKLDADMNRMNAELKEKLDDALNARDASVRQARHDEAREIVKVFQTSVLDDTNIAKVEDNGFLPLGLKGAINAALTRITALI